METLELPRIDEIEDASKWPGGPPPKFEEQAVDLAAFELWRQASRLDGGSDES
jgi:hypothetical protein